MGGGASRAFFKLIRVRGARSFLWKRKAFCQGVTGSVRAVRVPTGSGQAPQGCTGSVRAGLTFGASEPNGAGH